MRLLFWVIDGICNLFFMVLFYFLSDLPDDHPEYD